MINPLSPNCDLSRISHSIIKGLSVREVMRIENMITQVKFSDTLTASAKFLHSSILHYACGSMCVVLCFATKKQQKQHIVPQLLHCVCHYFPLTMTCMLNEVWGCAEI